MASAIFWKACFHYNYGCNSAVEILAEARLVVIYFSIILLE